MKAEPGHRAYVLLGARAVFTGRRKTQGAERANLSIIELDLCEAAQLGCTTLLPQRLRFLVHVRVPMHFVVAWWQRLKEKWAR